VFILPAFYHLHLFCPHRSLNDDVPNYVTRRIFNANLQYLSTSVTLKVPLENLVLFVAVYFLDHPVNHVKTDAAAHLPGG